MPRISSKVFEFLDLFFFLHMHLWGNRLSSSFREDLRLEQFDLLLSSRASNSILGKKIFFSFSDLLTENCFKYTGTGI